MNVEYCNCPSAEFDVNVLVKRFEKRPSRDFEARAAEISIAGSGFFALPETLDNLVNGLRELFQSLRCISINPDTQALVTSPYYTDVPGGMQRPCFSIFSEVS